MVKVTAAGMTGATVEWYDFFLFGSMAALIFNDLFFRHSIRSLVLCWL